MDSFWEAIIEIAQSRWSLLFYVLVICPWWLPAVAWYRRGLRRRRAFQDFAAANRLQLIGTMPSDAGATRMKHWPMLLWRVVVGTNVIEGQWDGLPIRLVDLASSRNSPSRTTVFVTVDGILHRGARAERAIAAGSAALIRTDVDVLSVLARPQIDPAELAAWLSFATGVVKAMEQDGKEVFPRDVSETAAPPTRPMFGMFRRA